MFNVHVELTIVQLLILHVHFLLQLFLEAYQILRVFDKSTVNIYQKFVALLVENPLEKTFETLCLGLPF